MLPSDLMGEKTNAVRVVIFHFFIQLLRVLLDDRAFKKDIF
jgi:hypothetical protein